MVIDDAIGRCEFIGRMGESGNHHHRNTAGPGQPGQTAGKTDKGFGMAQPAHALGQRPVAGEVLGAVRDVVPDDPLAVGRLLIDAEHAIAARFEKTDDFTPAKGLFQYFDCVVLCAAMQT